MRTLCRGLLAIALGVFFIAPDAEAAIRKCVSGPVTAPGFLMMVDGRMIGEFPIPEVRDGARGPIFVLEEFAPSLADAEVLKVETGCREQRDPVTNASTRRATISVFTRDGLPLLMESYLGALVERQEGYRAATGAYADNLAALSFFDSREFIPINMTVTQSGWSATAFIAESPVRCHVIVGSIPPPREGLGSRVAVCFSN